MEALKVVCVNVGDYLGRGEEYVENLKRMLSIHLTIPYTFHCLTEVELETDLISWWPKILLTKPGMFTGQVMFIDLDVVISGNIDHIIEMATEKNCVYMREDFSYPWKNPRQGLDAHMQKMLGGVGCANSSVMIWNDDALSPVWDRWESGKDEIMATLAGDQNLISQVMHPLNRIRFLPEKTVKSYKYHWLRGEGHGDICVFHGAPKPHEVHDEWIIDNWH